MFERKSNKLGAGGRAAQMKAQDVHTVSLARWRTRRRGTQRQTTKAVGGTGQIVSSIRVSAATRCASDEETYEETE